MKANETRNKYLKLVLSIFSKVILFKVHLLTGIPNNIRFNNGFQLNVSLAYLYFKSICRR